jgi:signal transduction histidine kinase
MTNMHMLLTTSCERVQDGIEEKHLELVIDLDKVKSNIYASAPELSCTFKKLLENAIQHTPDGGRIHLIAHEDAHKVIVDIRDTGEGIQPEVIPHIFDQFYRGDASRSTRTGGLGLGLTYVQRVVALHGGSIEVESTIGSGTTIRVLLPKNSPKAMPNPGIIGALSQQV